MASTPGERRPPSLLAQAAEDVESLEEKFMRQSLEKEQRQLERVKAKEAAKAAARSASLIYAHDTLDTVRESQLPQATESTVRPC